MSGNANTPGPGIRALGMTAEEFGDMLFSNDNKYGPEESRAIALRFLGNEGFEDVVATVRAGGPLSKTQTKRLTDVLGTLGGCLGASSLMLIYGLPGSRYEQVGLGMLSLAMKAFLQKGECPEEIREVSLAAMDEVINTLSLVGGKESVKAHVVEQRDAVAQLDVTMNNIMASIGMSGPKPG